MEVRSVSAPIPSCYLPNRVFSHFSFVECPGSRKRWIYWTIGVWFNGWIKSRQLRLGLPICKAACDSPTETVFATIWMLCFCCAPQWSREALVLPSRRCIMHVWAKMHWCMCSCMQKSDCGPTQKLSYRLEILPKNRNEHCILLLSTLDAALSMLPSYPVLSSLGKNVICTLQLQTQMYAGAKGVSSLQLRALGSWSNLFLDSRKLNWNTPDKYWPCWARESTDFEECKVPPVVSAIIWL